MSTILKQRSTGGHCAESRWTRHATPCRRGALIQTECGLLLGRSERAEDEPAVQGRITNCQTCERLTGSSLGEERQ